MLLQRTLTWLTVLKSKFIVSFYLQIRIKQEKLSDSEENTKLAILSGHGKIKSERIESSDESESDSDESTSSSDIKQEKRAHDCTSDSENVNVLPLIHNIKKEKDVKQIIASGTFIPRPMKNEPQSDTEGTSKFKTPTSNHKLNTSYTSTLKIKHEAPSEDESVVKRKKSKTTPNTKSLKSITSDLFDSFLQ